MFANCFTLLFCHRVKQYQINERLKEIHLASDLNKNHTIYAYQTALLRRRPRLAECIYSTIDRNFTPNSRFGISGEAVERMHNKYAVGGEAVNFTLAVPLCRLLLHHHHQHHVKLLITFY